MATDDRREPPIEGLDRAVYEVRAAGAVVWRDRESDGCPEVCVIHRPRYDDWSLPKGKLDDGETFEAAAEREVFEEIGVRGRLTEELPPATYTDHKGRSKLVRYWLMEIDEAPEFVVNDEVDEVKWCTPAEAARCVSYPFDAELLVTVASLLA
jgi:8-oxo-dGTP pyrophosphatase MutT (NUDIX family)